MQKIVFNARYLMYLDTTIYEFWCALAVHAVIHLSPALKQRQ